MNEQQAIEHLRRLLETLETNADPADPAINNLKAAINMAIEALAQNERQYIENLRFCAEHKIICLEYHRRHPESAGGRRYGRRER